jgi:high affinity cAMP-specific and IBMX-insensitive 3',5'-cyclic phosphodiesterase 8
MLLIMCVCVCVCRALRYLGVRTLQRFGVSEFLKVSDSDLAGWLTLMESHYKPNPYHNSTHAADVMHGIAFFLEQEGLKVCYVEVVQNA